MPNLTQNIARLCSWTNNNESRVSFPAKETNHFCNIEQIKKQDRKLKSHERKDGGWALWAISTMVDEHGGQ